MEKIIAFKFPVCHHYILDFLTCSVCHCCKEADLEDLLFLLNNNISDKTSYKIILISDIISKMLVHKKFKTDNYFHFFGISP